MAKDKPGKLDVNVIRTAAKLAKEKAIKPVEIDGKDYYLWDEERRCFVDGKSAFKAYR